MREGQRERKCNKSFHDSVAFIKSLQITVKSIQKVVEYGNGDLEEKLYLTKEETNGRNKRRKC